MATARIMIAFEHDLTEAEFAQMVDDVSARVRNQNRVGNVVVTVDGTPGNVVSGTWIQLEEGRVEAHKNEISIIAAINDPSGLRLASSSPEPTLGHVSGNALRSDNRQEMVAFILFKRWEAMRHLGAGNFFGAVEFWFRDPRRAPTNDDQQFKCGLTLEPDGLHLFMPVIPWDGHTAIEAPHALLRALRGNGTE